MYCCWMYSKTVCHSSADPSVTVFKHLKMEIPIIMQSMLGSLGVIYSLQFAMINLSVHITLQLLEQKYIA